MEMTSLMSHWPPGWIAPLHTVTNSTQFCSPAEGPLRPAGTRSQVATGRGCSPGEQGQGQGEEEGTRNPRARLWVLVGKLRPAEVAVPALGGSYYCGLHITEEEIEAREEDVASLRSGSK